MSLNDDDELEGRFVEGCRLRDEGDIAAAIGVFEDVLERAADGSLGAFAASCQLGKLHGFNLSDCARGLHYFRLASTVGPRSELASMGVFHMLLNLGRGVEAMEEAIRYLRLTSSKEYSELLLSPDFEVEVSGRAKELLAVAQNLILGRN